MAGVKSKVGVGKPCGSQCKEVISNVYKFMRSEADNNNVSIPLVKARERTAAATGCSLRTVSRINKEFKTLTIAESDDGCGKSFQTPIKTKKRNKPVTDVDEFDKCVIRKTVYHFHLNEKRLPTVKLLKETLNEKINFTGSEKSLRIILKQLGFKWKKCENNRKLLVEKWDVREKRITYLQSMKKYREEGRPIVYMDESYILTSHVSSKVWTDGSSSGIHTPISRGERLIIVHAGGEEGFVPNALLMWKAGQKSGDYHDNMNSKNYIQWVSEKLVPNLSPNTVLVIDNAKYHNVEIGKAPTSNSQKQDMISWLEEKNIPFDDSMLKPQLYSIILSHKPRFKKYILDEILQREGHSVLRLPPYHPDLNPIELIWAEVKNYVASRNTTFTIQEVKASCEEKMSLIGKEEWMAKCKHVERIEHEYRAQEPVIDEALEAIVINLNDTSEDSSEDDFDDNGRMSGIEELD